MYCKQCGKEIPDSAQFCKYCGATITQNTPVPQQQPVAKAKKPKNKKKLLIAIGAVVLAAVLVFGAIMLFGKTKYRVPTGSTLNGNVYNSVQYDLDTKTITINNYYESGVGLYSLFHPENLNDQNICLFFMALCCDDYDSLPALLGTMIATNALFKSGVFDTIVFHDDDGDTYLLPITVEDGLVTKIVDPGIIEPLTINFDYDDEKNITDVTYVFEDDTSLGFRFQYTDNRLSSMAQTENGEIEESLSLEPDSDGRVFSGDDDSFPFTVTYDANGHPASMSMWEGNVTLACDEDGYITQVSEDGETLTFNYDEIKV